MSDNIFHELPQVNRDYDKTIPITKWTRPSFVDIHFKKRKEQHFYFNFNPELLAPFELNIGSAHFRWVDGFWFNLGTDYNAACVEMNDERRKEYMEENEKLRSEIEILLDINTDYEMKKVKLRQKLAELESAIMAYPGVMDSDSSN